MRFQFEPSPPPAQHRGKSAWDAHHTIANRICPAGTSMEQRQFISFELLKAGNEFVLWHTPVMFQAQHKSRSLRKKMGLPESRAQNRQRMIERGYPADDPMLAGRIAPRSRPPMDHLVVYLVGFFEVWIKADPANAGKAWWRPQPYGPTEFETVAADYLRLCGYKFPFPWAKTHTRRAQVLFYANPKHRDLPRPKNGNPAQLRKQREDRAAEKIERTPLPPSWERKLRDTAGCDVVDPVAEWVRACD